MRESVSEERGETALEIFSLGSRVARLQGTMGLSVPFYWKW